MLFAKILMLPYLLHDLDKNCHIAIGENCSHQGEMQMSKKMQRKQN